jgi:uncharacterized protein YqgV (UPF0045/DUF77 family)
MTTISAQISIYPLRRRSIGEPIERAVHAFRTHAVELTTGPMSTVVVGEETEVFSALSVGFRAACDGGDAVMVACVSNACPFNPNADQTAQ